MKINYQTIILSLVPVILAALFFGALLIVYLPADLSNPGIVFVIKDGQSSREIALNLEKVGAVRSGKVFLIYAFLTGKIRSLQSGEYLLSPIMNIPQVLEMLSKGDVVKEKITIIEGWNLRDIGWYFENKGMFQAEELFELTGFPAIDHRRSLNLSYPIANIFDSKYVFLEDKPDHYNLEGYLFPDTYEINNGESLNSIIPKMLDNFNRKVFARLKNEIDAQDKSVFEIITMASMVEKEVITYEDKQIVSGVLWKRLESGMPLQVDATVNYITGRKDSGPTSSEKQIDSLYNTYKYKGLPLGPIANPGLDSIKAAIYTKESDFWYYLSTPEGKTIFSKTLQEHNAAVEAYLR